MWLFDSIFILFVTYLWRWCLFVKSLSLQEELKNITLAVVRVEVSGFGLKSKLLVKKLWNASTAVMNFLLNVLNKKPVCGRFGCYQNVISSIAYHVNS